MYVYIYHVIVNEDDRDLTRGGGREERVKTPSLQEPGSGQIQCTSWRNFAPFTTSTITDIHASARAEGTAGDRQWVRDTECEGRRHNINCIKQRDMIVNEDKGT
jgi:hypothetical protein